MNSGLKKSAIDSKENGFVPEKMLFPIVAIGASAGGLEALEQFLSNVPDNSGLAYVVIQHLDPTHKGMLPELLQRISKMKVYQVKDRMEARKNCIYVIPPNTSMSILNGVLYLFQPIEERGMRLPIDFFFSSLAHDYQKNAIGLVLSGMGSDGSAGLRAIKEKNGIAMVQDPSDAKFESMPSNAINSVLVDIVAPARELSSRLMEFLKHNTVVRSDSDIEIRDKSSLEKIMVLLRTYTGNDFSLYKKNNLYRRIGRRMSIHKIDKIALYVDFLQENPKELEFLFKELMIGVTNFFRDTSLWNKLKEEVLPNIISNLKPGAILRAWVAGCSTGEEAYSLAIIFNETLEKINPHGGFSLQIFATDLDEEGIEMARKGIFSKNITADVSPERLRRFFLKTDDGYFIKTEIRETIVFAQHNVIMHPPFTKLDILSCRNLLIYMEPELQKKLIGLFYYSLNPGGSLVLGISENLGKQNHLFTSVDPRLKIFKREDINLSNEQIKFPNISSSTSLASPEKLADIQPQLNIQSLAEHYLLHHFSPAGVLVNENGDIIYISGHTGKYLEPAVGKANMNIFAMLREGLRSEFPIAFRKAIFNKELVVLHNIRVESNGTSQLLDINIKWIEKPDPLNGMLLIIFTDVIQIAGIKPLSKSEKRNEHNVRQLEIERELKYTQDKLQVTLEEMQTSQEELKSTNEELQSTNEELQSANEELTSSKEEMQSLNEELQILNAELQVKVDDFSRVNNDMKNLLDSTDIATLFLDKELNIRRYTLQAVKIFKLIKSDIGRPFTDLVSELIYPEMASDATEVLKTLAFIQKPIPTKEGRWFSIRIMPYRTLDDRIDGLVITFINISDLNKVEIKLYETEQVNRVLLNSSTEMIIKLSPGGIIEEINSEAERFLGKKYVEVINKKFFQIFIPELFREKVELDINNILKKSTDGKFKMKIISADGNITDARCIVKVLLDKLKMPSGILLSLKK